MYIYGKLFDADGNAREFNPSLIEKERENLNMTIQPFFEEDGSRVFFDAENDWDPFYVAEENFVDKLGKDIQRDNEGYLYYCDDDGIRRYDVTRDRLNDFDGYVNGRRYYYLNEGPEAYFCNRFLEPDFEEVDGYFIPPVDSDNNDNG